MGECSTRKFESTRTTRRFSYLTHRTDLHHFTTENSNLFQWVAKRYSFFCA
ncbi:hypothetical protein DEV91_1618 [Phyllobacterium brassicacearum]|nr:hypothetical protein DEV91_1618 [Phyllobacterium brassicacearum]